MWNSLNNVLHQINDASTLRCKHVSVIWQINRWFKQRVPRGLSPYHFCIGWKRKKRSCHLHGGIGMGRRQGPALRPSFWLQNLGRVSFCHWVKWLLMWGSLRAMWHQRHNVAQSRGSGTVPTSEEQDSSPLSFTISLGSDRAEVKNSPAEYTTWFLETKGHAQQTGLDKGLWDPVY